MLLTTEEKFALQMLFAGSDEVSVMVRLQLDNCEVLTRKNTGVGFFTSIALEVPLDVNFPHQRDLSFEHRDLSHGGSFMCWFENASVLELEAVSYNGEWPQRFDVLDFKWV